jgi:replicative DNA helicase
MLINEQAVLRDLLTDWDVAKALCDEAGLKPEHLNELGWAYVELLKMAKDVEHPDYLGFVGWLKKAGYKEHDLEKIKEVAHMQADNLDVHLQLVIEDSLGRSAVSELNEYAEKISKAEGKGVHRLLERALSRLMELSKPAHKMHTFKETLHLVVEAWKRAARHGESVFIPTRFNALNEETGGWPVGVVTLLTARDGVGKSFLVCNEVVHKGVTGVPVDYYPFEDGEEKATGRMICYHTQSEPLKFLTGKVKEEALKKAEAAAEEMEDLPIRVIGRHMNMSELCSSIVRGVMQHGTKIVFIDGWKDIEEEHYEWNELREEKWQFNKLSALAERYNLAIVVIMHLTKVARNILITEDMIRGNGLIGCGARMKLVLQDTVPMGEGFKPKYPNSMRLDALKVTNGRKVQVEVVADFTTATIRLVEEGASEVEDHGGLKEDEVLF